MHNAAQQNNAAAVELLMGWHRKLGRIPGPVSSVHYTPSPAICDVHSCLRQNLDIGSLAEEVEQLGSGALPGLG